MTIFNRAYLLFITLLISYPCLFAQDDCSFAIRKAEKLYENGLMEQIPTSLSACLENGSATKRQKEQAHKLLILSSIFTENQQKANENILNLLKLNPEYKITASDPQEFAHQFAQFRTDPLISIGFYGGPNFSTVRVKEEYGVHNLNKSNKSYQSSLGGFQLGIKYLQFLTPNLQLNADLSWKQQTFHYSNTILDFAQLSFTEKQTLAELPLALVYNIKLKRATPYLRLGACLSYLYLSTTDVNRSYLGGTKAPVSTSSLNLLTHRQRLNYAALAGLGVNFKVSMGNVFIGADYMHGLNNRTATAKRYASPELQFNYYYIDDDFSINNVMLNVGYTRSFYKPKQIGQSTSIAK